ncbi:hypothetical protein FO519_006149 [Halicephalobus sp. NKZ332]|nr:hypothetical protein FO519_006149 [Halicephalobus sp. NKZ332]
MTRDILVWMGLKEARLAETRKNTQICSTLEKIAGISDAKNPKLASLDELPSPYGNLMYTLAVKIKPQISDRLELLVDYIVSDKLKNEPQLSAALEYLLKHAGENLNEEELKKYSGVGVEVTIEEIDVSVKKAVEKYKDELVENRYRFNTSKILADVRLELKWANGADVKKIVDCQVIALLGPKTEADLQPVKLDKSKNQKTEKTPKPEKEKTPKDNGNNASEEASDGAESIEELLKNKTTLHKVGENHTTEGYPILPNTKELLRKHVAAVGGRVTTRFPPEPNGVLHIGHAKAININFGYAKVNNGRCYLRFDDTNPEKEEAKFFEAIADVVNWLGYKPCEITHSSDYFDQLYEWAVVLIKKNLAYVCHQTTEEMRGFNVAHSPWRDRPIEESLRLFEDMKNGKIDEGKAILRLKHILEEGKVDPVAYRIKCIYPTYDYTHCLCDSIENISHSLCTKEFQSRRSSYYWLCNVLDLYTPVQWEYARLNMSYTVTSKRKIQKLIQNRLVSDYDDPRLFTLTGLRRRGIPSEAINKFVAKMGLTVAQTTVDPHLFDSVVRDYLNIHAPRTMAVLEPLKVRISNFKELGISSTLKVPDFPTDPSKDTHHDINSDEIIYIERSDYKMTAEKGFRRLTKEQPVGLKYLGLVLSIVEENKNSEGEVTDLVVKGEMVNENNKPKAFIHWVAKPVFGEVRLYEQLFKSRNPDDKVAVPGGFLSDINENTLTIHANCAIDEYILKSKVYDRYQFERIARKMDKRRTKKETTEGTAEFGSF